MDREIDAVEKIAVAMDMRINDTMKDTVEQYDVGVAVNVLIQVATSMLAKAVIMTKHEHQAELAKVIAVMVRAKVVEGNAAVESMVAIEKAMMGPYSGDFTCSPTNH
jgi:hypothetical protein